MQPFTLENIPETLTLFGISPEATKSAIARLNSADDCVLFLSEAIAESPHGATVDPMSTLEEGVDMIASACHHCGIRIAWEETDGVVTVDMSSHGVSRQTELSYQPGKGSFHTVAHEIEKALEGQIRIFTLRSTYATATHTYAVHTKHDWERLLRILGAQAFNMLFLGLDGRPVV